MINKHLGESLYGNWRQRKFVDIWNNADDWLNKYHDVGIPATITDDSATTLFYLLYARYGNSTIASSDEEQFQYKVFATIFQYGPAWEKRLDLQQKIREMSEEDLMRGSRNISNHAFNPSSEPSTSTLDELTYINEQNSTGVKRGKLDAYASVLALLETDVTEEFLSKFKKLFLTVVQPEEPLWYITEPEEYIDGEEDYDI